MIKPGMTIAEAILQLTKGFRKMMGRDPDGLEKIKIQQEAVTRLEDMNKVVDLEGNVIDTSKGIIGGQQIQDSPEFGKKIRETYDAAKGPGKGQEMVDALKSPGAKKSYEIIEKQLGVKLYGDETFEEVMEIQRTGKHPRGEPKADGGRIGLKDGLTPSFEDYLKERGAIEKRENLERLMREYQEDMRRKKVMEQKQMVAEGGRAGFKVGSIDKARRAFLKTMGLAGAGITALKTGLLSLTKGGGKEAVQELITTPSAPGKPAWFDPLVTRIIREGEDVTETMATKDRQNVYRKKIDDETEVMVTQDLDEGVTRVDIDDPFRNVTGFDDPPTVSLQVTDEIVEEGGVRIKPKFEATENDYRNYATDPDGGYDTEFVENTVENTKDLTSDLTKVKSFATKKKPTMKEIVESKKRKDNVKYAQEQPSSYAADRGPDYDPSDYIDDMADDFASGGIARMLGE